MDTQSSSNPSWADLPDAETPKTQQLGCAACGKISSELRRCSKCQGPRYCDRRCQAKDWPTHKKSCETRFPLYLLQYAVVLGGALLSAKALVWYPVSPTHYWKVGQVMKEPKPQDKPDETLLFMLDERSAQQKARKEFYNYTDWPMRPVPGETSETLLKLCNRLFRRMNADDGHHVAINVAIITALHSALTSAGRLTLLMQPNDPITDYGLCQGYYKARDRLNYIYNWEDQPKSSWKREVHADPSKHTWIYMVTSKGEEIILDYNAMSYNFTLGYDIRGFMAPTTARAMNMPNVQPPETPNMMPGPFASMAFVEGSMAAREVLYPPSRVIRKKSLVKLAGGRPMVTALMREFLPVTQDFPLGRWQTETDHAERLTGYIYNQLIEVVEDVDKLGRLPAKPMLLQEGDGTD